MKLGTKSLLWGAHAFWCHPIFLAIAWWRLYGFPWDPRLWAAFAVHDIGYWNLDHMDDERGEQHPFVGARIVGNMFDAGFPTLEPVAQTWYGRLLNRMFGHQPQGSSWYNFCCYHSRYLAKRYGHPYSKLCVADKMASFIEPRWFYILRIKLSGEIEEYVANAQRSGFIDYNEGWREWHAKYRALMRNWVAEHKDLKPDMVTEARTHA